MTSMSPGESANQSDDTSQTSPAISAVESESEDSWRPETRNRKRHTIQSTRIDSNRRKRRKGDSTGLASRMDTSVTASSSLASPLLCSNCYAPLPSKHLDERPMGAFAGQRNFARHTPFSEVSSDIKGAAIPIEYRRKGTRHRRSRSSVLEDLVQKSKARSTKGIPRILKKRPNNNSLSAIDRFIVELNDEDQSPDSESDSESSTRSDDTAWDESQGSPTQSPELEHHSPINARTRNTRRSCTSSEQRPTNDLRSSLLDFMDDLNESEEIRLEHEVGSGVG